MSSRRMFPTLFALTAAGAVLLASCGSGAESDTPAEAAPALIGPENLFVAETSRLQNGPLVSGSLEPERAATIRAELAATVTETLVEEGQAVTRGQLLARLNDDAVADQALSARSAVRTATEALEVAKRNAERTERLANAGAVAERELEQARWTVTNAEATLADANARLAAAEKQLGYTRIRAPLNGVVSERNVKAGDNVSVGNPLFTVVDPSSLQLEARVPVTAVAALKVGTPVPFTVDGYADREFEGKVIRINPAVDPATRQVRITVALPNKAGRLVAGLYAQGRVALESHDGVVVPTAAIDRRGLKPAVTKIEKGVAQRIEVALGVEDPVADRIEITQGIVAGDTVITGAARGLQPGTKVRASAAAERAPGGASN